MTMQLDVRSPFCVRSSVGSLSAEAAQSLHAHRAEEWGAFSGLTVVLHGHPAHMVRWILALDGIAEKVILAPFTACELFARRIVESVQPDAVLIDEQVPADRWSGLAVALHVLPSTTAVAAAAPGSGGERSATQWVLATSGTTGTPKLVCHTVESLTRTVSSSNRVADYVWGLLYDPARFAGLQVVLQSMAAGCTLVVPSPEQSLSLRVKYLVEQGVNALSATPTLWRSILMVPEASDLKLRQITLGGEIADAQILAVLRKKYPLAHITHIYASTEAGVGFAVHDGMAGFPASWLKEGVGGRSWRVSPQGTLEVQMRGAPQRYLGSDQRLIDESGWLDTGDMVSVAAERVTFLGRLNGSINIGGNKVMPEEVEGIISNHPVVVAVAVRAKSSSVAGALVEALVQVQADVPQDSYPAIVRQIKEQCRAQLPSYKVPAFVRVVDHIPVSDSGKAIRSFS